MNTETKKRVRKLHLWEWLALVAVLSVAVALIAPQQLPVLAYKCLLLSAGALAGYALDRSLFPYARPDQVLDMVDAYWMPDATMPELSVDFAEGHVSDFEVQKGHLRYVNRDLYMPLFQWCMARRALLIFGAMLAVGLGA